ncbi:MAG: IS1182 family transposase [Deltaproteobacteria bacterium]|nr:IS1182 family transposase [Deltaproteobacteria bacterium]
MKNQTHFKPYQPNQLFLLPPDMKDWLPDDHLVYFVMEVVEELDLSAIYQRYDSSKGGQPPFDPKMMTSLLFYAYCIGLPSSRKMEKATYERVAFRILTADQHPDHDTIADFRKRHLDALSGLFVEVLRLSQKVGLVKLGHVSLDGTKVKANASKHKAMSYGRMEKKAEELEAEVKRLLRAAQAVDDAEDAKYGKGKRGDELPKELRFKQDRLKKIKEAMESLEQEAKAKADAKREEILLKEQALEKEGKKRKGKEPKDPGDKPSSKSQRNFTDPESRIMKDGASKSFEQAYNCQAAVDEESQIIVATNVTQQANDKQQLEPLVEEIKKNTDGRTPEKLSGDNGYFSESNVQYLEDEGIDGYIATDGQKHGAVRQASGRGRIPKDATRQEKMARKLRTKKGRETYSKRKQIVEPVFGQIKEGRGFRRFLLRGLENVSGEWDLICLTHNLLKLFRSGLMVNVS